MEKDTVPTRSRPDMDVDEEVPIPDRQKYPFAKMKVGDSFLLTYSPDRKAMAMRVRGAASQISRRYTMRFAIRIVPNGVRVWRTR